MDLKAIASLMLFFFTIQDFPVVFSHVTLERFLIGWALVAQIAVSSTLISPPRALKSEGRLVVRNIQEVGVNLEVTLGNNT